MSTCGEMLAWCVWCDEGSAVVIGGWLQRGWGSFGVVVVEVALVLVLLMLLVMVMLLARCVVSYCTMHCMVR